MKILIFITLILFTVSACGPESSPEGRMGMKLDSIKKELYNLNTDEIRKELDSLRQQNAMILDSIKKINQELSELKLQK